jgi:hypothetical protein
LSYQDSRAKNVEQKILNDDHANDLQASAVGSVSNDAYIAYTEL